MSALLAHARAAVSEGGAEFGREQHGRLGGVSAGIQSFATEQYAQDPQAGKHPAQRLFLSPPPCVDGHGPACVGVLPTRVCNFIVEMLED